MRRLSDLGLEVAMLTGGNRATARRMVADPKIDQVFAEARPAQKVEKVRKVQQEKVEARATGERPIRTVGPDCRLAT